MGWLFGNKETTPTQQFGAPSAGMGMGMGMGGMQGMGMQGMNGMQDPTMMMQMAQNPMMQQAANDPVVATSKLLNLYDPVSMFIVSQNMGVVVELIGEVMLMCMKDFFTSVNFKTEGDAMKIDSASMPAQLQTLSSENLALTLQKVQSQAQALLNQNQQQMQMLLMAHQQGMAMNPNNQPGFFGNLLGGIIGNQMQQGGMGNMAKAGVGAAAVL